MNLEGKSVLIIKPSSMGDVIHTLPVAHAIKRNYPGSRIGWVIQSGLESFLENDPSIDEIFRISIPSTSDPHAPRGAYLKASVATIKELFRLRKLFQLHPYDIILDLHASFRSALISFTNPDCRRYGLEDAKELNTYFQDELIRLDMQKPHAVDKNLASLSIFGVQPTSADFQIYLSQPVRDKAEQFLAGLQLPPGKKLIYANPAARWITKMWNPRAWAILTQLMIQELDAIVIFGGGPSDTQYIDGFLTAENRRFAHNVAGKLKPVESAALMEKCSVYVGVDSGPMHIAAFLGLPILALFGPTDPNRVGPYSDRSIVIRNESLNCLSCRKKSCEDHKCMNEIDPHKVLESLKKLV